MMKEHEAMTGRSGMGTRGQLFSPSDFPGDAASQSSAWVQPVDWRSREDRGGMPGFCIDNPMRIAYLAATWITIPRYPCQQNRADLFVENKKENFGVIFIFGSKHTKTFSYFSCVSVMC